MRSQADGVDNALSVGNLRRARNGHSDAFHWRARLARSSSVAKATGGVLGDTDHSHAGSSQNPVDRDRPSRDGGGTAAAGGHGWWDYAA